MAAINKRKLLESAQKNLQKGALDRALKDYQDLLAADPRDANVRLKVGDLQLKRGNADDAITAYLKVADQFMRDGFDAKAVAIYKQVTKIDGKRFDVYIPLADLYQRIGLTSDAMAALQTAAEAYQRDGRRREALDLLRRMASLDPTNTTSRLKVAELLHQEDLPTEAITEFEEAAAELERQGDWEGHASVLARLIEIAPARLETYDALLAIRIERNQMTLAEPLARKLIALDPARAESQETLATILQSRGQTAAAIEAYRAAADAWLARGDDERARAILQRHIPSEPFDLGGGPDRVVPGGAAASPISDSPFGEEGIGGEPPPVHDEFRFVDDGTPAVAVVPPSGDVDFELELDEAAVAPPAAAATPAPVAPAPAATPPRTTSPAPIAPATGSDDLVVGDVDQLLAEAAVYLRYGKHERAIASLQAVLAQEPHNLPALEQLGEVHFRAEAPDEAVAVWCKAFEIATTAGDAAHAESLRTRIEAIDAAAAAALPEVTAPSVATPPATLLSDTTQPEAADESEAIEFEDGDEIEIDLETEESGDEESPAAPDAETDAGLVAADAGTAAAPPSSDGGSEIEIDAPSLEAAAPEAAGESAEDDVEVPEHFEAADGATDEDESRATETSDEAEPEEIELDESVGADAALAAAEDEAAALEPPAPDAVEAAPEAPVAAPAPVEAPAQATANPSDLSGATSQQIIEDLEEASFYFEQGLFEEAEAIYQRVVQRAPSHPAALLRLGEIAVARGEDPSQTQSPVEATEAPAPSDAQPEADAEPTIEPPDDLDLTAREFGPQRAWEEESAESDDPMATASDASQEDVDPDPDSALDRTDPTEWTTPDAEADAGSEAEAVEAGGETSDAAGVAAPETVVAAKSETDVESAPEADAAPAPEARPLELTAPEIVAESDGAVAFDLAAELSDAMRDETPPPSRGGATEEDGFASLFSEFKRGVSRTLGEGDVETHFDLGIAYREMGLLEDAIGEFRYALGSTTRRLDALHMMGLCALDVGRAVDAIGHLEQALASPDVPGEREAALRYDLGRAYESQGDRQRALDALARVFELDPDFQDTAQRIEALRAAPEAAPEATAGQETYESFDDLLAQTSDAAADAAPAEPYESFEEFSGEDAADEADEPDPNEATVVEIEPAPEPEPEPEPSPPTEEPPRRKRKISFF